MPGRRRLVTGYQLPTMISRVKELRDEIKLMGEDGRCDEETAAEVEVLFLMAHRALSKQRVAYRKENGVHSVPH
jgi:hypothetical protein